ncbi:hypothetical protein ACFVWR_07065 [Leifsonia sp. NPDC058292]|uniref:hypothetical protein n=1 Tax=Leifsonia sp. NPDC058292 TaxID=3346428 RepID=UPI0036D80B96
MTPKEPPMPRRRTAIIVTSIAVVAVAALGVGAYAVVDSMAGSFHIAGGKPAAAAEHTPTVTPTPTVVPLGGVLDEETALDLRREMPDSGDFAYKMPDGRWVKTNRLQPMPAEVMAAEQAKADAVPLQQGHGPQDATAGLKAANAAAGNFRYATGKQVVFISQVPLSADRSGSTNVLQWNIDGGLEMRIPWESLGRYNAFASADEALAFAHQYVDPLPDVANWDIVVAHQH